MSDSKTPFYGESVITDCSISVLPEWTDYNDHFNVAYYVRAFDIAADTFRRSCGASDATYSIHKSRVSYLQEVHLGSKLILTTQVIAIKRPYLHLLQTMYVEEGLVLAAIEERVEAVAVTASRGRDQGADATLEGTATGLLDAAKRHENLPIPTDWGTLIP